MKTLAASALALCLVACSSTPGSSVESAVSSPLRDLNVVNAPVPPVLQSAREHPYALPALRSCEALATEVLSLDDALGPDLDAAPNPDKPGLIERGGKELGQAGGNALQGAAENLVPFRGWVRKLSGAERYSRRVASAIAAGSVRRGFLKGLALQQGCSAPAAPRSVT